MSEYVVEIPDTIPRKKIEAPFGMPMLTGCPVREDVIRCRDCEGTEEGPWHRCETYLTHGENPDGFCAWAVRRS